MAISVKGAKELIGNKFGFRIDNGNESKTFDKVGNARQQKGLGIAMVYGVDNKAREIKVNLGGTQKTINVASSKTGATTENADKAKQLVYRNIEKLQIAAQNKALTPMQEKALAALGGKVEKGKLVFNQAKVDEMVKLHEQRFGLAESAKTLKTSRDSSKEAHENYRSSMVEAYAEGNNTFTHGGSNHSIVANTDEKTTRIVEPLIQKRKETADKLDTAKTLLDEAKGNLKNYPDNAQAKSNLELREAEVKKLENEFHSQTQSLAGKIMAFDGNSDLIEANQNLHKEAKKANSQFTDSSKLIDGQQEAIAQRFGNKGKTKATTNTSTETKSKKGDATKADSKSGDTTSTPTATSNFFDQTWVKWVGGSALGLSVLAALKAIFFGGNQQQPQQ